MQCVGHEGCRTHSATTLERHGDSLQRAFGTSSEPIGSNQPSRGSHVATSPVFTFQSSVSKAHHLQPVPEPDSFPRDSFINKIPPLYRAAHTTSSHTERGTVKTRVFKRATRGFAFCRALLRAEHISAHPPAPRHTAPTQHLTPLRVCDRRKVAEMKGGGCREDAVAHGGAHSTASRSSAARWEEKALPFGGWKPLFATPNTSCGTCGTVCAPPPRANTLQMLQSRALCAHFLLR